MNYRVRIDGSSYFIDLAYPKWKIGIELDSWEHHGEVRVDFTLDRIRGNKFKGWDILHFSWDMSDEYILATISDRLPEASS